MESGWVCRPHLPHCQRKVAYVRSCPCRTSTGGALLQKQQRGDGMLASIETDTAPVPIPGFRRVEMKDCRGNEAIHGMHWACSRKYRPGTDVWDTC